MKGYTRIREDLFCVEDSCRVYIIRRGDRCILIDFGTGMALQALEELGIHQVEAVLMTHHHRDQGEGLSLAVKAGIPILVPETEYDLFVHANEMWQSREIFNNYNNRQDRFSILESVPAQKMLDYDTLHLLGMEVTVLPTPGHTTGSISLLVPMQGELMAFCGDLLCAPGKLWSLAATQWSYNGGEGIPHTVLSLLELQRRGVQWLLPSHGERMEAETAIPPTVEKLARLRTLREQNPRLFQLRERPYEAITPHVLFNRTSMANSYVLLSQSGKAMIIDFGYDFMAGPAAGVDRSSRHPWLYTLPTLQEDFGVTRIDACIPTHYHDDHVAGFNLLRRIYGTRVLCSSTFADILENPQGYDLPCLWYDPIPVDQRLPEETEFFWEEYRLVLHPLSGHTRFAVAIEVEADGEKFLFTGDQYAGDEGTLPNYVYKNLWEWEDFSASAKLYRAISPDWILSGHWTKKKPDESFYQKLESIGTELSQLHRELLPENGEQNPSNDFSARFSPYQKEVAPGETFTDSVELLPPNQETLWGEAVVPNGFTLLQTQRQKNWLEFTLQAPMEPQRRSRLGCRVWREGNCLGTQAEMLITVLPDKKQEELGT